MPAVSEKNPDLSNLLARSPLGTQAACLLRRRTDDVASVVTAAEGRDRAVSQPLVRTDHMGHQPSQPRRCRAVRAR
jgi:hypothetical protein